jgi:gluconolactonase
MKMMHPSLTVYKDNAEEFINFDFEIQTLSSECEFTEGPVWNTGGYYLFSDITANCIYKINESGKREVFLQESGTSNSSDPDLNSTQAGSNGLAYDSQGNLIICRHGSHSIAKYEGKKMITLAESYNGRKLNSPNDLIVHSDKRIFFSDPPYGLRDGKLNQARYQEVGGVYALKNNEITRFCEKYQYPNGVCLSPDEKTLFICSNKPFEKFVSTYDTGTMKYTGVFAEENGDGIETDPWGNIYLCNKDGLLLLNNKGQRMALLSLPDIPANCCWGGERRKDLFICARKYVLLIRDLIK